MILRLNKYWTDHLLKYPETGMGYQRVDVILKSGRVIRDIVVFNSEALSLPDKYKNFSLDKIKDLFVLTKEKK